VTRINIEAEFVVAAAEVLHEGVPGAGHSRRAESFQAAHRPQPGFQAAVVGFDRVVRILLHDVAGARQQLLKHARVGGRPVGAHLGGPRAVLERVGEELAGGRQFLLFGDQDVDDLAELVDRTVQLGPPAGDLDVGLIDEPSIARGVSAWPGCVDEQGREALHPAEHANVVDGDATLSEQFFHASIGQPVAQVPAHRQHDDLTGEAEPSEARSRRRYSMVATTHQLSLPEAVIHQRNSPTKHALTRSAARYSCRRVGKLVPSNMRDAGANLVRRRSLGAA
jgi:hypothetical protein